MSVGDYHYLSMWAKDSCADRLTDLKMRLMFTLVSGPTVLIDSYERDVVNIGREHDAYTDLSSLNEQVILDTWSTLRKCQYNTVYHNCATVIANCLIAAYHSGGGDPDAIQFVLKEVVGLNAASSLAKTRSRTSVIALTASMVGAKLWYPSKVQNWSKR